MRNEAKRYSKQKEFVGQENGANKKQKVARIQFQEMPF